MQIRHEERLDVSIKDMIRRKDAEISLVVGRRLFDLGRYKVGMSPFALHSKAAGGTCRSNTNS